MENSNESSTTASNIINVPTVPLTSAKTTSAKQTAKKTVSKKTTEKKEENTDNFEITYKEIEEIIKFIKQDEDDEDHQHFVIRTNIDQYELNYVFNYIEDDDDEQDKVIVNIYLHSGLDYTCKYDRTVMLTSIVVDCGINNITLKQFLKNFYYIADSNYVQVTPFDWSLVAKPSLPKFKFFNSLYNELKLENVNKIGRKLIRKNFACTICYEDISQRQKTKCGHGLCFYCYYKLENKTCPVCRTNIDH